MIAEEMLGGFELVNSSVSVFCRAGFRGGFRVGFPVGSRVGLPLSFREVGAVDCCRLERCEREGPKARLDSRLMSQPTPASRSGSDGPRREPPSAGGTAVAAPRTFREVGRWIERHLRDRGVESPKVCADYLLAHVVGCERMQLYMRAEEALADSVSEADRARLRELVLRAGQHEPVQYLVGRWPFRGREFELGPSTLIPRESTNALVDRAVAWYRASMAGQPLRMADIGTGTGIIAISVIAEIRAANGLRGCAPLGGTRGNAVEGTVTLPEIQLRAEGEPTRASTAAAPHAVAPADAQPLSLRCLATDRVPEAVELARRNVAAHGLSGAIDVRVGSLFEPFRGSRPNSFDIIASNPPYISDSEWAKVERNVREYEPESALRGGVDGLDLVRSIVADAPHWLRGGGLLLVEIGYEQGPAALALAADRGTWASAEILKDFEGHPRVLAAILASR
jgi:release factor glutamine methyltransferase